MRRRARLFWTLQIGGWGLYGMAMLLALLPYMKWREVLIFRGVFTGLTFIASLVLHRICRGLWRRKSGLLTIAVVVLPCCLLTGYLSALASILTEAKLFPMQWAEQRPSFWLASLN